MLTLVVFRDRESLKGDTQAMSTQQTGPESLPDPEGIPDGADSKVKIIST